jgi:hypothetical protein
MRLPPKPAEIAFEEFLKELPPDHAEIAYEFKAFSRGRKIKTPAQLLQVVMLYCGLGQALRTCAGSFSLLEERITDTAVHRRLRACGPWLKALLQAMLPSAGAALNYCRLLVVDGSSLQGPGAEGTDYRVHLALDLVSLSLHELQVTGSEGGESLARYPWQAGDIALADRGYNHPRAILELDGRQVRVIVRLVPTALPLCLRQEGGERFDPGLARLDMAEHLRGVAGDTVTLAVWLRGGASSGSGWIHAARLPPEAAEAARRRCRQVAKRKGWTPSQDALYLAGWVMVFTTVPPDALDGPAVLALYRCRWQVELVFKRLKGLLGLDELRTRQNSVLGEVWVRGKLLYALVIELLLHRQAGRDWSRMDQPREATPWRFLKIVRGQVDAWILDARRWRAENWPLCFSVVKERPRRRQLQTLPARAVHMMEILEHQPLVNTVA